MVTEEPSTIYDYQKLVNRVYHHSDFEFVGIALQAELYPYPIKWCFVAGNRNERFRKITLRRGFEIAGLVLRTGKPFYSNDLPKYTLSSAMYTPNTITGTHFKPSDQPLKLTFQVPCQAKQFSIDIKFVVFPNYINGLSGTIVDN